jgi:hypothetical protein
MVGGAFGRVANANVAAILPKLNIEVMKLINEFANVKVPLAEVLKSVQDVSQGAAGVVVSNTAASPLPGGSLATLALKIAYVAVLKEAMDKATQAKVFNVETAINDLLLHLESVRKLGSAPAMAAAGSAGATIELTKLRDMVDGRQKLFQLLSDLMRTNAETSQGIISNIR